MVGFELFHNLQTSEREAGEREAKSGDIDNDLVSTNAVHKIIRSFPKLNLSQTELIELIEQI